MVASAAAVLIPSGAQAIVYVGAWCWCWSSSWSASNFRTKRKEKRGASWALLLTLCPVCLKGPRTLNRLRAVSWSSSSCSVSPSSSLNRLVCQFFALGYNAKATGKTGNVAYFRRPCSSLVLYGPTRCLPSRSLARRTASHGGTDRGKCWHLCARLIVVACVRGEPVVGVVIVALVEFDVRETDLFCWSALNLHTSGVNGMSCNVLASTATVLLAGDIQQGCDDVDHLSNLYFSYRLTVPPISCTR
jgi:hypothetical protein